MNSFGLKLLIAFFWLPVMIWSSVMPVVEFNHSLMQVNEQEGEVSVELSLDRATDRPVALYVYHIDITADSLDHSFNGTAVVFSPGETTAFVSFTIHEDSVLENRESFTLRMSAIRNAKKGAQSEIEISIYDNFYDLPEVGFNMNEQDTTRGSTIEVEVSLSHISDSWVKVPFVVSGTSQFPDDHNLIDGTLHFLPGTTRAFLSIKTMSNNSPNSETIAISLLSPTGDVILTNSNHIINIINPTE
jgi:hypothetical protein